MNSTTTEVAAENLELWISPFGDDTAKGGKETPLRSLRHAHDTLTSIAKRKSGATRVTIYLADGLYRLDAPLVFDSAQFGPGAIDVAFKALPGAAPIISGGIQISGWKLHDARLNIYKASVPANSRARQLFVNGKGATRARTKMSGGNNPAGFLPKPLLPTDPQQSPYVVSGGIAFVTTALNDERWRDPTKWRNPQQIEAVIKTQWKMMRVPLQAVASAPSNDGDCASGTITLQQPAWTNANLFFGFGTEAPGIWSFWQVTYFENALEFLDHPGEWYLDQTTDELFYCPREGEDMSKVDVELPVLETLIEARGTPDQPVANLRFEGITFRCATWLAPNSEQGYVADQSGFHLTGDEHLPNYFGHAQVWSRTPGNLQFHHARDIVLVNNRFENLGAVAVDFGPGCQRCRVERNHFEEISSAAIQLGGVSKEHRNAPAGQQTSDNVIANNRISRTGRDYVDSAAIYIGFARNTLVEHNSIDDVPWAGIAIGWGWGLLDEGMFPGIGAGAASGMWGTFTTPTTASGNKLLRNRITRFLQDRWDGGAIYTNGQQGPSMEEGLLIEGNVAQGKRPGGGGNTFYTDAGSRYILLNNNVSLANPIGHVDLGPPPQAGDPLPYTDFASIANILPYGGEIGGCCTYGDIRYENNYWRAGLIPLEEIAIDAAVAIADAVIPGFSLKPLYSAHGFYDIEAGYMPSNPSGKQPIPQNEKYGNTTFPTNLVYVNNHDLALGKFGVPEEILRNAGPQ